jgi:hypothetical protein
VLFRSFDPDTRRRALELEYFEGKLVWEKMPCAEP